MRGVPTTIFTHRTRLCLPNPPRPSRLRCGPMRLLPSCTKHMCLHTVGVYIVGTRQSTLTTYLGTEERQSIPLPLHIYSVPNMSTSAAKRQTLGRGGTESTVPPLYPPRLPRLIGNNYWRRDQLLDSGMSHGSHRQGCGNLLALSPWCAHSKPQHKRPLSSPSFSYEVRVWYPLR